MENEITDKHKLSLSAVMLMAPVIFFQLKTGNRDNTLTQEDKNFINGYIKYGIIIDILISITIVLGIINFYQSIWLIEYAISFLLAVVVLMIIAGSFLIFSEKNIFKNENIPLSYKKITKMNINLIFYYLPVYNFYLWYNTKVTNKSLRWLKESILMCILWIILSGISMSLTILFILIYVFRVVSLLSGIDMINDNTKSKLNQLFTQNPEEIFGYIKGSIIYTVDKIRYSGKELKYDPGTYINKYKREYSSLTDYSNKYLLAEYLLLILLLGIRIDSLYLSIKIEIMGWIYIIPLLILIGRYLVMLFCKKLPYIPVLHELILGTNRLINFLK